MTLYWTMPTGLKTHFRTELHHYRAALNAGNWPLAWRHLERAHVVGQAWPREHSWVHWHMLRFGIRIKNTREIVGQVPRLLVGGVKSFVGHIPVGNTGGANVPPLRPMEIPADLAAVLAQYGR